MDTERTQGQDLDVLRDAFTCPYAGSCEARECGEGDYGVTLR